MQYIVNIMKYLNKTLLSRNNSITSKFIRLLNKMAKLYALYIY